MILSDNPMTVPEQQLADLKIVQTIKEDRVVYSRPVDPGRSGCPRALRYRPVRSFARPCFWRSARPRGRLPESWLEHVLSRLHARWIGLGPGIRHPNGAGRRKSLRKPQAIVAASRLPRGKEKGPALTGPFLQLSHPGNYPENGMPESGMTRPRKTVLPSLASVRVIKPRGK